VSLQHLWIPGWYQCAVTLLTLPYHRWQREQKARSSHQKWLLTSQRDTSFDRYLPVKRTKKRTPKKEQRLITLLISRTYKCLHLKVSCWSITPNNRENGSMTRWLQVQTRHPLENYRAYAVAFIEGYKKTWQSCQKSQHVMWNLVCWVLTLQAWKASELKIYHPSCGSCQRTGRRVFKTGSWQEYRLLPYNP
jgi:hypothetical protein